MDSFSLGGMVAPLEPRGADMKKIVSFGDSFIFGSEIPGNRDGSMAWPGQIAKQLGVEYQTYGDPGCGNDAIARQIYTHFATNSTDDTLAVINWTWTSRWDFYITDHETWISLGPTCVPEKLQHLVDQTQSHRLIEIYTDYLSNSVTWNKIRNLQVIFAAQQYLKIKKVKTIQTFMDNEMFSTEFHCPEYILELQNLIKPEMSNWGKEMNFLDWCRYHRFTITEEYWHPLLDAHIAAAKFWIEKYKTTLL